MDKVTARCPACGQAGSTVFVARPRDREYFTQRLRPAMILRCTDCLSLHQSPWPSADELRDLYGPDYQNYTTTRVPLLSSVNDLYQRRLADDFVARYGRAARVLDFGCGQGAFLRTLMHAGVTTLAGFDFVLYPELASERGLELFDDLAAVRDSGRRFDVIRMRHVIEHLTDLDGTMRLLAETLAPGGCIIGQTPNAAHYTAALWRSMWGPLHFPYHTVLFSPKGLAAAAARWQLQLTETRGSLLPSGWAISLENLGKQALGSRRRGRTPLYTGLMAMTLPLSAIDLGLSPRATANFDFVLTAKG